MRTPALLLGSAVTLLAAGCSSAGAPFASCLFKSDCAADESCVRGVCEHADMVRPASDAGPARPDAQSGAKDVGPPDPVPSPDAAAPSDASPGPDAGVDDAAAPDAHAPDAAAAVPDAGFPCAQPITVLGGGGYCTIASAIADAPAGATVNVPAGTYHESLSLSKPITVCGPPGCGRYAPGSPAAVLVPPSGPAISILGTGIAAENFAIQSTAVGVEASGAGAIRHIEIDAAVASGVHVTGSLVIESSTITHVVAKQNPQSEAQAGAGVHVEHNGACTAFRTWVHDTDDAGFFADGANLSLKGAIVTNPGKLHCSTICAPGVYGNQHAMVSIAEHSKITGALNSGVLIENGTQLVMTDSESSQNLGDGLDLEGGTVQVTGSVFDQNDGDGIFCCLGCSLSSAGANTCQSNRLTASNCNGC